MKLIVVGFEAKSKGVYSILLKYGARKLVREVRVCEGAVLYAEYESSLQEILHRNVGDAKNMHRLVFKLHRQEFVEFPLCIGNF